MNRIAIKKIFIVLLYLAPTLFQTSLFGFQFQPNNNILTVKSQEEPLFFYYDPQVYREIQEQERQKELGRFACRSLRTVIHNKVEEHYQTVYNTTIIPWLSNFATALIQSKESLKNKKTLSISQSITREFIDVIIQHAPHANQVTAQASRYGIEAAALEFATYFNAVLNHHYVEDDLKKEILENFRNWNIVNHVNFVRELQGLPVLNSQDKNMQDLRAIKTQTAHLLDQAHNLPFRSVSKKRGFKRTGAKLAATKRQKTS